MSSYTKGFFQKATKSGVEITPEMLEKINRFAPKTQKAEDLYVRKFLLAHDTIDRDRERFPESMLTDFVNTLPGKSFLFAHDGRNYLPIGLWFDAVTESITPEKFKELTGEDVRFPPGQTMVKVLFAWNYMLKSEENKSMIDNIDAGIYRHVSIRFNASDLNPIKEDGLTLYYEYFGPGEAEEGSLVWLGGQNGATSQKAAKDKELPISDLNGDVHIKQQNQEELMLKGLKSALSLDDDASESVVAKKVREIVARNKTLEPIIALIGDDATIESVKTLKDQAVDGAGYRKSLIDDALRFGSLIGEVESDGEKQKKEAEFLGTWPIDRLKSHRDKFEAAARKEFPQEFTLKSKDQDDKDLNPQGGESPLLKDAQARADAAKK